MILVINFLLTLFYLMIVCVGIFVWAGCVQTVGKILEAFLGFTQKSLGLKEIPNI